MGVLSLGGVSLGTVAGIVFVVYMVNSMYTLYKIFHPPQCTGDHDQRCLQPAWHTNEDYRHQFAMIVSTEGVLAHLPSEQYQVVYNDDDFDIFQITADIPLKRIDVPESVRQNGTLYLHACLDTRSLYSGPKRAIALAESATTSCHSVKLSRHVIPKPDEVTLVGSASRHEGRWWRKKTKTKALPPSMRRPRRVYTHLPTKLTVLIMATPHAIPLDAVFPEIAPLFKLDAKRRYMPMAYINMDAIMGKDLVQITPSTAKFDIKLNINQATIGKLKFLTVVKESLKNMEKFGLSEQDVDSVKGIFFDTSLALLLTTIFVSTLHLLFDVMAFKNDVVFWRTIDKFEGISVRTIAWKTVSQVIIWLYLYDNDTSRLVLFTALISTLIEMWKFYKVTRMKIIWRNFLPVGIDFGKFSAAEQKTDEIDSQGMQIMSIILIPLCIGGAIYSLYYQPHKSWYSWTVGSLANAVYAFGFLLMMPQLFLNYRLKSVAHLPWRVFMYKAFNTFIDDLFAFIIHMPTAHRIACFRDDIVFIIFLYQRWLYPVDKSRPNEFGESFEDAEAERQKRSPGRLSPSRHLPKRYPSPSRHLRDTRRRKNPHGGSSPTSSPAETKASSSSSSSSSATATTTTTTTSTSTSTAPPPRAPSPPKKSPQQNKHKDD